MQTANIDELSGRSRLFINVATSWFTQLILVVTGFFLPRIIDNELGQASLGIWDFAWSIAAYVSLSHLGIGAALNRYVAKYRANNAIEKLVTAVSTTVTIQLILAFAVAVATVLITLSIPLLYVDKLGTEVNTAKWVIFYIGLSISVQLIFDTSRGVLTGCHRWDMFNGVNCTTQVLGTAGMIATLWLGGSLVQMAAVYTFSMLVQGIARSAVALRICPEARFSRHHLSLEFAREIFTYGGKSILVNIAPMLIKQGTFIAVASTLGPAMLAILARPLALINYLHSFITRFTFILTPMAASIRTLEGDREMNELVMSTARLGMAFTLPPMTLLTIYGDEIIAFWMGAAYVNQAVMYILCLGAFLSLSQSPILRILIGLDKHGEAAIISLSAAAAIFALMFFYGYYTDSLSLEYFALLITFCSIIISGIIIPFYSCYKLNIPIDQYLSANFNTITNISIFMGLALFFAEKYLHPQGINLFAPPLIYCCIIGGLYWAHLVPDRIKQNVFKKLARS